MRILENGASYVRKGGTLLYSTCTLNCEENEAVVDRFLAAHPSIIAVGLCYASCLCERLPHDHHDVPVSYVISERSVIRCVR